MADLIPKDTDEEMDRYAEAEMVKRAGVPLQNNAALSFEADPITGRENIYHPLSSGGYVKIGDRAVTPAQAATTDALAVASKLQNEQGVAIGDIMGGAYGPVMDDYLVAGFTEAQVRQYEAQRKADQLKTPGVQIPVQLTPEQIQMGVETPGAALAIPAGPTPIINDLPEPRAFEKVMSAIAKGLVEGTVVNPLKFLTDTFGVQDPQILQDLEQNLQLDDDADVLLEQLPKGFAQFLGPFAAVGKLLRLGRGFVPAMAQGAAADFLGFEGNEGRLTDVLLEMGVPPNAVTELLKTDPNDPDYIGRIKNAAEGALIGLPIEGVARVVRALRGGSAEELDASVSALSGQAQQTFQQRMGNFAADAIGAGRAIVRGDTEMLGEVFQRGGEPRGLGAAASGSGASGASGAVIRPDDVYRGEGIPKITVREASQPYVVRGTQQSQIDDMIQSGMVRPKPGGYGANNSSQLYFGESSEVLPTSIFARPTEDRFVLVGDSAKLAGTEGPIPINQLRHVWAVRNGETVDILPEILQANRNFDNGPASSLGAAAPEGQQVAPEYLRQIGVETPPSRGGLPGRISTRLPTAARATEDPMTGELIIGYDELRADPKVFEPNVNIVRDYPNMRVQPDATTDEVAEQFITHVKDNLLYLHDQVPEPTRVRSQLWYDGARNITDRWAQEYGVPDTGVAGALAALSPQKDWYQNVSLAQRVLDVVRPKSGTPIQFAPEMETTFRRIDSLNKPKYEPVLDAIRGKSYDQITDPDPAVQNALRALFVRLHDQTYTSPDYRIVGPEGDFLDVATNADGSPSRVGWGSLNEIGKAIGSIEANGNVKTISRLMGERHKVRNFYNNIYDPNSPYGDVTIDTHAVAAGLLRPLSGNSLEVDHNFKNTSVPGRGTTKGSAISGVSGNYGLYAEAYRRAAEDRGILPRQMQSITWEAVRGLFPDTFKTEANANMIDAIWNRYRNGEIEIDEARRMVNEAAGGINPPTWQQ